MTDHEISCLRELSGDVRELGEKFTSLASDVRAQLVTEGECRKHVESIHAEVFGIDGKPDYPGLKGQMRDVKATLSNHDKQLGTIQDTYKEVKSRGISWLSGATIAIIGAILGAVAKHYIGG